MQWPSYKLMQLRTTFIMLALALLAVHAQDEFSRNAWQLRFFGSPERIHFLPKNKAILVDSKGFALIDTTDGSLAYVVSERIHNSGIVNGQLVIFNKEQKKLYVMDPLTGALILDKKPKSQNFFDIIIRDNAIYYISETQITREKTDEEVKMDFEDKRIIIAFFEEDSSKFLAFVEESDIQNVCIYHIDSNLHKMERKNCGLIPFDHKHGAKMVNAFLTKKGMFIAYDQFFYSEDHEKIKFFLGEDASSRALLKPTLEEFTRELIFEEADAKKLSLIIEKSQCAHSSDIWTRTLIKEICPVNGLWSKAEVKMANGNSFEVSLIDNTESSVDFFVDTDKQTLLVKTSYDTLIAINIAEKRQIWRRDEGLGNLANVLFVQNPTDHESLDYLRTYEALLAQKKIIQAWHLRVDQGIRDTFHFIGDLKTRVIRALSAVLRGNLKESISALTASKLDSISAIDSMIPDFKTSKTAIFASKSGKLFAFDLEKMTFVGQHVLPHKLKFEAKERDMPKVPYKDAQAVCQVSKHDAYHVIVTCSDSDSSYLLNHRLEKTSNVSKDEGLVHHTSDYGFQYNAEKNELVGVHKIDRTWTLAIPPNQKIVILQRIQDLKIPKFAHVIENKNVLYRVIDPNNALLVTHSPAGYHVRVVNLKFGKFLFEALIDKIDENHRTNFLVDDGSFFVNYFNSETLQNELLHIEIFRKKVENDFMQIIKAQFSTRQSFLDEIDYSQSVPEYIVTHKRYALPFSIKSFIAFDSKSDLTSKNLLVITESDQVYSLSRSLISTRRIFESEKPKVEEQLNKPNKSKIPIVNYFKSTTLPAYDYFIPLDYKKFITKHLTVGAAEKLWVEPSNYESTSVVVCGGKEIFIGTHAPDNKFDQLPEDFSKAKLWALFVLFVIGIFVTNRIVHNKRPMEKYLANA